MRVDVLLGLQWGDEGKGKIADVLSPGYEMIARFQGGPNAGHTLEFDNRKFVLNTVPSGIFRAHTVNLIGNGVVIDPVAFSREIRQLDEAGYDLLARGNLVISKAAHLILPTHKLLETAMEKRLGARQIGSTLKGIGPAYTDKTARSGLRAGDIFLPDFRERYRELVERHRELLYSYGEATDLEIQEADFFRALDHIARFPFEDSGYLVHSYLKQGKKVLAEGAQGTLLDLDFGTYPFVTSSTTTAAGACTGLGIAPGKIGDVIGIFKAYATRVGGGPFPTELAGQAGEKLRLLGREFGANTGRPRRTGWLDLPALRYAVMLNGVTRLVITKADVLTGFDKVKICTHYRYGGKESDLFLPGSAEKPVPVFREFEGWKQNLTTLTQGQELPRELLAYIGFIERELGVPVTCISVGPEREQTLLLR